MYSFYLFITVFERIVNTCFLCFPVSISFLNHCIWLLSMTLLNLASHSTSDFHSGPFSFSSSGTSFPFTPNSTYPQDSAKNPLGLFLIYPLSLSEFSLLRSKATYLAPSSDWVSHIHLNPLMYRKIICHRPPKTGLLCYVPCNRARV